MVRSTGATRPVELGEDADMARRPRHQRRSREIRRGAIAPWTVDADEPRRVASRATYRASGEHKDHPPPIEGLWTVSPRSDKAKCERIGREDWPRVLETLRAAIEAGCVGEFRGGFPSRVWAFVNGVLHEARLTNELNGEYHAFPLNYPEQHPDDPDDRLRTAPRVEITVH